MNRNLPVRRNRLRPLGDPVPTHEYASGAWLFTCDFQTPIATIAELLSFGDEPRTELSAAAWDSETKALTDLAASLGAYGPMYDPNWDAFNDCLVDAFAAGHLVVIRDIFPTAEHAIGLVLRATAYRLEPGIPPPPSGRVAVVLEGWQPPTVITLVPTAVEAHEFSITNLDNPNVSAT